MSTEDIVDTLRRQSDYIRAEYRADIAGIFGSYARGEAREDSDLDVLVDFQDDADLFDLIHLSDYLESLLGHRVDLVSRRALRNEIRSNVLRDLVAL